MLGHVAQIHVFVCSTRVPEEAHGKWVLCCCQRDLNVFVPDVTLNSIFYEFLKYSCTVSSMTYLSGGKNATSSILKVPF